ncbi:MAG: hypothetical protein EBZ69_06970 [Alphaproteobacteria bacterium]|nr:hypothetical protein [Alphaproteobacteria bacterium]NDC56535.1 hypothetical protein [Alphaproteobacteria bacterium]NDG04760.1 hypothetical protein [Alphaproteobacteria bacterium]
MTRPDPILVQQAVGVMQELIDLLEREPSLLIPAQQMAHQQLVTRKHHLMNDYDRHLRDMKTMQAELKLLPEHVRQEWGAWQKKLMDAVRKNEIALRAAMKGTKELIQRMVFTIRSETEETQGYNSRQQQLSGEAYRKTSGPVVVNRQV